MSDWQRQSLSPMNRQAFGLLMVIVALVIATTALVRLAGQNLRRHQTSLGTARSLQAKWGRLSMERLILPAADDVFASVNEEKPRAEAVNSNRASSFSSQAARRGRVSRLRQQIELGQHRFEMVLADESAKANFNWVRKERGAKVVQQLMRAVVPPGYSRCLRTELDQTSLCKGWGDIFVLGELQRQHGSMRAIVEATADLSIWGGGTLNIHRAPEKVLRAVCSTVVPKGRADRLIEVARDSPAELEVILQRAVKNETEQAELRRLLSDGSSTFSLWVESTHVSGASDLSLAVRALNSEGIVANFRFWLY